MKYLILFFMCMQFEFTFAFDAGLKAYEKTLYPALRKSCVACHAEGGIAVGHSVSDVTASYKEMRNYVDFTDLAKSVVVKRVKTKHWLKYDTKQTGMEEADLMALLQGWWDEGEFASTQQYDFISAARLIPSTLPTMQSGTYTNITWDLGDTDSRLNGCTATSQIQRAQPTVDKVSGSYRVRNLTIYCSGKPISVSGVYYLVSDQIASYENIFDSVMFTTVAGQKVEVKTEPMILIERNASDTIKIVFHKMTL